MEPISLKKIKGKHVIIICDDAEFSEFKLFSEELERKMRIKFFEKIDDFDTMYWKFLFFDVTFILYYNIFDGISIYLQVENEISHTEKIISFFELLKV